MSKAWIDMQVEFQSDDTLSRLGMNYEDIRTAISYMVDNHYVGPNQFDDGYDFDRWLRNRVSYYPTLEAFALDRLEAQEERIPAGVVVNWDATAEYFLTDVEHVEFEDGGVLIWTS